LKLNVIPAVVWTREEDKGVSKIFRNGAVIYTAVVVARNTGRLYDYYV
jgi:hypothetical protein